MARAYLSLGSNLGDRERQIREALGLLGDQGVGITRLSSFYETAPRELENQPWFLNVAAEIETELSPEELLGRIQAVESALGRQRTVPKGPRTLDIDILLYEDRILDTPELVIPHAAMHERRFVLEPLTEIAPNLVHPKLRRRLAELLGEVRDQQVRRAR